MHESSHVKMAAFRRRHLTGREMEPLTILDLGSQDVNGSYRPIFDAPAWRYTGLDMSPGKNVDVVLRTPYHWREISSGSADVLISGQTFEHIEFFWITILEIARVLKPGGLCCLIAPSGGYEHRYPVDCWRFYPDGFSALSRFARLETLSVHTRWEDDPSLNADESNRWKDSVLVARKPRLSFPGTLRRELRRWLLHRLMAFHIG